VKPPHLAINGEVSKEAFSQLRIFSMQKFRPKWRGFKPCEIFCINKKALMKRSVRLLKALGDETRFEIVLFLLKGRKSVTEITTQVKKAQPTVSLHLKFLELSGLVQSEREGRQVFYNILDPAIFAVIKALGKDGK